MSNTKKVIIGIITLVLCLSAYNFFATDSKSVAITNSKVTTSSSVSGERMDRENPPVKKSSTGICHPEGGTYYYKTKNFRPFASIEDCLNSGGRLPKR